MRSNAPDTPSRILYTMIRVGDLDQSIAFYRDGLGMRALRRETFPEGRFTLVFMGYGLMGYGDADASPMIELTWNWDESRYEHGTGYGHIALGVADVHGACLRLKAMGATILRAAGPMTFAPEETGAREIIAFVEDPDGYRIELIGTAQNAPS